MVKILESIFLISCLRWILELLSFFRHVRKSVHMEVDNVCELCRIYIHLVCILVQEDKEMIDKIAQSA